MYVPVGRYSDGYTSYTHRSLENIYQGRIDSCEVAFPSTLHTTTRVVCKVTYLHVEELLDR